MFDIYGQSLPPPPVVVPSDPKQPLVLHPHWRDKRFFAPQSVYCARDARGVLRKIADARSIPIADVASDLPGLSYNYNDRLEQGDAALWRAAKAAADRSRAPKDSARWLSALLSHYHGRPCHVRHVIAGTNPSNGHSWWAAGWSAVQR